MHSEAYYLYYYTTRIMKKDNAVQLHVIYNG